MPRSCTVSDLRRSLIWMKWVICEWQAAAWHWWSCGGFMQKRLLSLQLERVAAKVLLNNLCHERGKNSMVGQSGALWTDQSLPSFSSALYVGMLKIIPPGGTMHGQLKKDAGMKKVQKLPLFLTIFPRDGNLEQREESCSHKQCCQQNPAFALWLEGLEQGEKL